MCDAFKTQKSVLKASSTGYDFALRIKQRELQEIFGKWGCNNNDLNLKIKKNEIDSSMYSIQYYKNGIILKNVMILYLGKYGTDLILPIPFLTFIHKFINYLQYFQVFQPCFSFVFFFPFFFLFCVEECI